MDYVTAMVREDHIEQIEEVRESESRIDSDDEAVRHIFDRAREADILEKEIEHLNKKTDYLKEQHEKEVGEVVDKYSRRLIAMFDECDELREKQHDSEEYQGDPLICPERANLLRRLWWWVAGRPD